MATASFGEQLQQALVNAPPQRDFDAEARQLTEKLQKRGFAKVSVDSAKELLLSRPWFTPDSLIKHLEGLSQTSPQPLATAETEAYRMQQLGKVLKRVQALKPKTSILPTVDAAFDTKNHPFIYDPLASELAGVAQQFAQLEYWRDRANRELLKQDNLLVEDKRAEALYAGRLHAQEKVAGRLRQLSWSALSPAEFQHYAQMLGLPDKDAEGLRQRLEAVPKIMDQQFAALEAFLSTPASSLQGGFNRLSSWNLEIPQEADQTAIEKDLGLEDYRSYLDGKRKLVTGLESTGRKPHVFENM